MKANYLLSKVITSATVALLISNTVQAQDKESPVSVSVDLVSRYVWRGTDFGNAPAVQPTIELGLGSFAFGVWGSYPISASPYLEADLYASYSFGFGLDVIATDYYFPAGQVGVVVDSTWFSRDAHTFEIGLNQGIGDLYISGYYFLNASSDLYFEAGYSFKHFGLFAGAGNESYTTNGGFSLCNVGVAAVKSIKLTETFSFPLSGAFIINPDKQQVNIVVGISF